LIEVKDDVAEDESDEHQREVRLNKLLTLGYSQLCCKDSFGALATSFYMAQNIKDNKDNVRQG
jgi:hypothetical protein